MQVLEDGLEFSEGLSCFTSMKPTKENDKNHQLKVSFNIFTSWLFDDLRKHKVQLGNFPGNYGFSFYLSSLISSSHKAVSVKKPFAFSLSRFSFY